MQARRRAERANFREEMRRKHKLKSCDQDRELSLNQNVEDQQEDGDEEGVGKVAQAVVSLVKDSWNKLKTTVVAN